MKCFFCNGTSGTLIITKPVEHELLCTLYMMMETKPVSETWFENKMGKVQNNNSSYGNSLCHNNSGAFVHYGLQIFIS
jgi:hypothetical protein